MAPRIVFCADDFTGASDTLATLARAGLRARLFLNAADAVAAVREEPLDAVGVATSLRAMAPDEAHATMEDIAPALASLGARVAHYKICSTFDSAPAVGNIAAAADVFAAALGAKWIAVLGGQPSLGRYCAFGNLFAAAGDGAVYRVDRHPTMRAHPITPMTEADLRIHLGRQGWERIGLIEARVYASGPAALAEEIAQRVAAGETRTLFDVIDAKDVDTIGPALSQLDLKHPLFCVGASSVAEALFRNSATLSQPTLPPFAGPVFAFAGSRSVVSAEQVRRATVYVARAVDPDDLLSPERAGVLAQCCHADLAAGRHVLVQLSARPAELSGRALANASGQFINSVVSAVRPGCVAIAGGDTSSAAVAHLGIQSLSYVADLDRGVPLVRAHAKGPIDGLPMVLKGGQVGGVGLFDTLAGWSTRQEMELR